MSVGSVADQLGSFGQVEVTRALPQRTSGGLREMMNTKAFKRHISVFLFECQLQGCCRGPTCEIGGLGGREKVRVP